MTSTDVGPLDLNVQLTQEQGSKDVTDDVLQIISAIEQGQDPSAVDEEFAPAAGENGGSSLQTSATIVRDGTELLASTSFETIGIESLGLSQTQVLALNDLFRSNLQTSADSTDKPLATTPVTLDAIEEDGGSIIITTEELLSNVDDEDKDTLSVENLIIDKGNGTLVDNGDGTWTFTPQIDDDTEVSFTFDIIDDEDLVVSGSANLDILPINDAPNAKNDVITTEEDTAVTIDVLVNDSDVEGDVLSIQSASVPSEQGSVDIVDGKLVFTPAENFNGEATITYIVTDGDLTDEAKVTVTVTPVNDSPVAVDDTVSTQEDTVVIIDVLPNDSDVDGDKLSIQSASVPEAQGKVEIVDGKLVFTPAENFNGDAEITSTVTDGELTDEAKVTVTVNPVNDVPTIKVEAVESITEDAVSIDTVVAALTVRDTDTPEDQLTVSLENNSNGYFVLVGDEVKLTQAGVDAVNNDELNLKDLTISASVSDGVNPTASDSDSLIVNRVNDAPTIKVDAVESITEDAVSTDTVVATLTVRDTDTPEDQLTVSLENNSNGYFVLVGNEVKLTQAGVDAVNNDELNLKDLTISASVSDGVNPTANDSDSLIVNRVNDAPVAKDDIATTQEDTAVTIDVLPNDSDVDGDKLSIQSASVPEAQGKVEIVDGKLVFTPAENFHGDAEITYTLTDGALTDQATVNVTVNAVNDTPVVESNLADQTLAEDFTPYTIDLNTAFSDVDNVDGELTFSVSGNSNVLVSIENGIATISPTADWNGSEILTFKATDPSGESISQTVNFTVAPVADIVADKATVVEDTPTIIKVLGNDTFEGGDQVVSLDTNNGPANGTVSVNPDGSVTYTPNDNYHGTDSFTYIVTSGGVSESTTVNVDVTPVNDAPVAKDDIATTQEDTAVTIDALPNDTDADGDKLSIESASVPKEQGMVEVVDGKLVFTPAENFNGDAEITYTVTDGQLTDEAKVTVTVNPVNDAPTIKVDAVESITEDAVNTDTVVATLTVRDTDTPEDQLTVSLENNSNGYFVLVGNEVKLTQVGVDAVNNDELNLKDLTISASVSDGVNPTANDSDSLVVNRVNDAPTVENAIADQVLSEDFATYTIDLNEVFKDTDSSLEFSVSGNNSIQISIVNGVATINPTADWNGSEILTFTATDPSGESVSQTVNFTVAPVVDIEADSTNVVEDTPTIINVLGNDTFEGKDKVVSLDAENGPKNGTVIVNNDGTVTYTPNDNYVGKDTFTYIVTSGGVSESTTVEVNVTPVNDAPVAKDDIATTQEDTAVTIDVLPNDTDVDGDKLSIQSASVPEAQGKVEIVDGKLVFTPAENFNGDAEITYTVTDGALTDQATVKVTVNAVNDTPVVESNIADQALAEDFTPYTINLNTAFSDVDNVDGELTFSVSGNSNIQVAIVNGIATITPTADWNGSETLTFTATDPSGESISQTVNFTVAPVADIVADSVTVVEDTPTIIKVLGNDTFEGDDKVVSLDTNNGPANGTVSINPDGSVTYTPNDNYHGTDSFTYIVTSGGVSESTTVSVDVTPVNDAPVAKDDIATTQEDTAVTIDVLSNDTDVDGDKLSIQSATVPEAQGKVEIVDGKLVFTPAENFNGHAEITYTVTDGQLTDEAKVTVTVNPVNDAPTIKVDAVESITEDAVNTDTVVATLTVRDTDTSEDQLTVSLENNSNGYFVLVGNEVKLTQAGVDAVNNDELNLKDLTISASVSDGVNPTANDSDSLIVNRVNDAPTVENAIADQELSEDFATYTIDLNDAFKDSDSALNFSVSGNSNVLVSIENGIATISPTADWNGSETLTFTATDPSGESVSQTVNFTVASVADIVADKATVVEDTPTIINVLSNDTFESTDKVVSLDADNGPKNGSVIVNNDGTVTYTPDDNYVGKDTFTYVVTSGGVSESTTVTVNVTPVNDAPVAKDDIATTQEDTAVTIDVLPNDTDVDGDKLSIESVSVPKEQGTVEVVDGKLVFTPAENFNGDAEITYTVTDGALTDQATVKVTVNAVNDTPVVESNIADQTLAEDFTPYTIDLNTAFSDVDNVDGELTFSVSGNSNIQVAIVNGIATITPTADWNGSETLTFTATDPSGESVSQPVNFTVAPVADIVADKAAVVEDTPTIIKVLGNDTFEGDGKVVSLDANNGPANGTVSVNPDGSVTYTPNDNYVGKDTFTYVVTSGGVSESTAVEVNVTPVNDAPVAKDDIATTQEDTAVTIDVLSNDTDVDGDKLSIQSATVPEAQGKVEIVDGKLVFTPAENFNGHAEITYTVTDGALTDQATVKVTVNAVNDTPVVESNIADQALAEDFTPYTIDLNTAFSDVDNVDGELTFSVSGNSNIQVAIVNGIATITPTADWNGSETLTFTATDPSGESVSQTVDFTVAPVVDIEADSTNVVEDTPTIINVLGNDTFEGKDKVVSLDAENGPKNGTVTVNNDGTVTYTPDDNYVGKDTFTYVVTSGGVSESTTVTVNVTPVNDKPESEDFTHVADDQLTHVVFDTDTKPLGSGDSKDHIADVEDDLKGNDLHVRITELPTSGTLFFKDSDGELHEIKEVSDTLYDKDSLYYEADNVGFLLGIKDRPNTPNGSESTSDFNNWGLSEDGGPSHSRIEHLANGASITISSDSGELAQYNRQVSHIGNGIADNDGQGIEKGETITVDLSNNPVGSVNLGLDGLGGLFDYGDDNAALITVTYLDSNNVQQTQTFEFLKPEGNFMLFQETSVGYGKDLALPEGSVITQLDFSTKNEGNWELRYVEGVPAEDSFGYVAVDSESGVSDPSTVNIVNEMLDGNVAENGPAVQSITGVTVVEGDNVTFSVSLNNATDQTVKYQVDFSAEGSSTSSQDIDLSNATFTNGVKYLGGYLIVPAGVNGFDITIPSIDDQLVESTESLVIKVGDVSGVGYIDDNDVPPTVQSNEISGLEDEAIVITLEHLGVVDSEVSVEFDTSALNGSLQVKGSDGWEVVSGSVLASDIENGFVRYVPAEHESGADVFDKDGVGNGLDTYEQIHFTVSDGNSSASGTLSIDIEPVADPIKIDLTFGPVTSVPVTLGGSWSTDEELKDLLEASNLPGLDFEHVVTQAFNNGHAGNDLMLSGDTESPLSFVGDQQAGANVDAQGSDIFVTGGGNDSIYGGIGSLDDQAETDTVVYSGKLSDYDFSYYPASDHSEVPYWIVEDSRFIDTKDVVSSTHKESGDHLYEIEQLIFQDAIIKLDNNTGEYVVLTEQQVSFELNLDLIDVDGSESFINDSVTLTGIPSGLTLEVNGKTVTENSDGSYTVDLSSEPNQTSHQLSGTITVPADYNGSLDFDVTATAGSVEVNNNTQMGADTASVSVRDYEFVSGTHGDNNIVGSDDNDVIVGDVQGLQIVEGQDYNIAFMLDTSGSMGYDVGRAVTELKTVLNTLIESASGPHSGKVNVLLTTFSTESKQVLELDLSSDNAKSQVESILDAIVKRGDGNTNYEAGFQSALNWFDSADSGATNLSYFISDGRPNQATVNDANNINQMDSIVLGVENNKLVTLADVLPADYKTGDVVTYDNKTVIDSNSLVYSLSTGELLGKMTSNHSYYDYETYVLHQANNAYQALEELSEVRSIGLGHDLDEDSLKHFDSDGVVRTNIDVNQLAEVILGKEVSLMQGKDEISSLDGNDIIFGDAIRFDINGEQGVSALQNYVASQLGKDVALVTKEEVHHYITENQAEFEQSRYYDQADTIYGGAGNDILFGQGGNDKLFGGADNDILIGGLGSDILTGGDGEDIFKWIDVANERDTVTDFSSSEDSLDFSDLFDDLSKDEVGDLLSDLQSGSHTGDAGGYHVEVSQDGSADTNLSITKGSSTLDIHFNSASVDDITQHLIASLDSQYKDM
ncbi:tandem-95 repeat protein [Vibrio parahaemolyticus]|uniref:tandem-95 repeat protein n=4 Tax=Vibrio parahaemolyticus TaxID=670 RepID=UPI003C12FDA0